MKKLLIILSVLVGLILAALWLVPFFLEDKLRVRAEKEIDQKLDAIVTFDKMHLSFLKHFPNLTVSFHNLNVTGKGLFQGDTLASIEKLHVGVNLLSLIEGKELELKRIDLEKPKIAIEVLKDGKANYNIFISDTTSTTDTSSLNIALDKIEISDGTIIYDDRSLNTYIESHGVDYEGKGDFDKEIFDLNSIATIKEMTYDFGEVRYLNKKFVKADMVMEMNLKEYKFTFKENNCHINHFKFGFDGFFKLLDNGYDMDLKFAARETSFKNVLSLVPGVYMHNMKQIETRGDLAFDGFVKGVYSDTLETIPAFHINLKIKDAMFKVDTLPTPVENINIDLALDNPYGIMDSTIIDLKNFHMDMGKHPFHGRMKLQGFNNYKIDADIFAGIELSELEKMYPIKGLDLKGKLDFELKAKGNYISGSKITEVPAFSLNLKLANGKVKYDHLPAAVENIQLDLLAENSTGKIENTKVQLKGIHLNMGDNPLHGYVNVEGYPNYKIDADLDAVLDLADIERIFPVKGIAMKGKFDLDLNANGIYNSTQKKFPTVDAKMNLTNGWVKSVDYPEPIEDIHLIAEAINPTGNYVDTKINIKKLTYKFEEEPFEIQGSVSDLNKYVYDLKMKGLIDLAKITKIYPLEGMELSGLIDTDIETKGSLSDLEAGKYASTSSDGTVEIKNLLIKGKAIPKAINLKDALFTFTPAKIILDRFEAKFGRSNVSIKGDLYNYMCFVTRNNDLIKGDLTLLCDTLDLNEWLSDNNSSANSNNSNKSATKPADTTVSIQVWEVPKFLDFTFDSDIKMVLYEDMRITSMDGEIKLKDGIMSLHETGFNTLNAEFSVSGDYDTRVLAHPVFDFDLDIKELDIHKAYKEIKMIRDLAPAAGDAQGIFSITYKLKGELDKNLNPKTETLVGGGEIRIAEAKVNGMKIFEEISKTAKKDDINDPHLKDFVMVTEIKDNKLIVKPFSIKVSGLDTDIEGISDLNGTIAYVLKIELLPINKLKIPFHVTGTYDKPKVAIGKGHKLPE